MQKVSFYAICLALLFTDCNHKKEHDKVIVKPETARKDTLSATLKNDTCALERKLIESGLVNIATIVPEIKVDVRYSTNKNFMQRDLYGELTRVYLQKDVAEKLKRAQELLRKKDSTLTLLVFDGVRPKSIQKMMWEEFDMPAWKKGKFLSNPAYGSLHNFGAAVDISIADKNGIELDMGTPYDDTARLAYPELESHFLATKQLSAQQVKNRQLLRQVMYGAGFFGIQTEWWHFNSCTRDAAKQKYKLIE